jgi:Na+/melibiose symporter-like transporter
VAVGVFLFLRRREFKRVEAGETRVASWRLALATLAVMVALFSGGCSVLFMSAFPNDSSIGPLILLFGVLPCLIAILVFWLSMRRKRQ